MWVGSDGSLGFQRDLKPGLLRGLRSEGSCCHSPPTEPCLPGSHPRRQGWQQHDSSRPCGQPLLLDSSFPPLTFIRDEKLFTLSQVGKKRKCSCVRSPEPQTPQGERLTEPPPLLQPLICPLLPVAEWSLISGLQKSQYFGPGTQLGLL